MFLALLIGGSVTALIAHRLFYFYYWVDTSLETIVKAKREQQAKLIASFKKAHPLAGLPAAKQSQIRDMLAEDIVAAIGEKRVTAYEVVLWFCHAALAAHEKTNCLTEIMFEEALHQARELDEHHQATGSLKGPLHGVPISLKDTVAFKGKDSTVGVIKLSFKPKGDHAPIVRQLMAAGGVPFVKTNVPQTMTTFECRNPLWGRTENPFKKGFSPGGSSGGEGALLALKGSVLGMGNDIGGSLRIPAHYSGICALKPSYNRVSFSGSQEYIPATIAIHAVNGPMARCVDDLTRMSAVLMHDELQTDPRVIMRPFSRSQSKKLRFGIAWTDGFIDPVPAVTRALAETKEALTAAGHEVVDFQYPANILEYIAVFYGTISADGGHHFLEILKGEPIDPTLKPLFFAMQMHPSVHRSLAWVASRVVGDPRLSMLIREMGLKPVKDLMALQGKRLRCMQEFDALWKQSGIDVLLCPPMAMPATPYESFTELNFVASYTLLWNLLDYVAGVIPVTKVDAKLDGYDAEHPPSNILSSHFFDATVRKHYCLEKMEGLPLGVQVVGMPYHEELVLEAMKVVESALAASFNVL